jgi:hypothetical protein
MTLLIKIRQVAYPVSIRRAWHGRMILTVHDVALAVLLAFSIVVAI